MSDLSNARAETTQSASAPPVVTQAELAAFAQWRAEQMGLSTAGAPIAAPAPADLADSAYSCRVGELVASDTGYGLIVDRGPVVDAAGATVDGYKLVNLGVANDNLAPLDVLGYKVL